jgi:hypothetical protein
MSNYDYRYNVKVAVDLAIRDVGTDNEYRVKEGLSPEAVSDELEAMGWEWGERDSGYVDEWVYDTYTNEAYPDFELVVAWHGWYGLSDISVRRIDDARYQPAY